MIQSRAFLGLLLTAALFTGPAFVVAQTNLTPSPSPSSNVALDAIRCWWRTEGAIRIGQAFDVVLTCAVLDNDAVQVVPDETRLSPEVVQMAPFEVLGGSHPADVHSGPRRFFQYVYSLRIISPDSIGKDVTLPSIEIHYRVTSRMSQNAAVQGRDLVYLLPATEIRVLSLVPAGAADIREAPGGLFADLESLLFRERLMRIGSVAFLALGLLMTVLALVPLARRRQSAAPKAERLVPVSSVLRGAARELDDVRRATEQGGWTDDLVGRALSATRLAATCAVGRNPAQTTGHGNGNGNGALTISSGPPGARTSRTVWSAITSHDLTNVLGTNGVAPPRQEILEQLQAALAAMTGARFGRALPDARESLDDALATSSAAVRKLAGEYRWPMSLLHERRRRARQQPTT